LNQESLSKTPVALSLHHPHVGVYSCLFLLGFQDKEDEIYQILGTSSTPRPYCSVLRLERRQDRQSTCNIVAHSPNQCCRRKATSITYSVCVCVSVCACAYSLTHLARNAYAPYYTAICCLSGCTIFFHIISKWHNFQKTLLNPKCVLTFSTPSVRTISHSKHNSVTSQPYTGLHLSTRYSCQMLLKIEYFPHSFEKFSNIKFNENPSTRSRVVLCGQTDMTKLIVAFRNIANAPKNYQKNY
jgi:hypothetical protein